MNKTAEEKNVDQILEKLKEQHGDNFLLILTPTGNGNVAIPNGNRENTFTNIMFDRLATVMTPNSVKH
ncbi:hypothetical protein [Vibrio mediterranei]|uniref:Uncharacterized protein n=1 Tax=Vibrio mediterranei TaxID=689 RepID=A0ABX5D858_9VIBR|nr:hypothetical protein [Vibrio mediterranei]PRQ65132.1 hypothetical protein COR51_23715 [Vibrio mediterranei]